MDCTKDCSESECQRINRLCFIITILAVKNILFTIGAILAISYYINIIVVSLIVLVFLYDSSHSVHSFKRSLIIAYFTFAIFCVVQLAVYENNQEFFIRTIPEIIVYGLIPFSMLLQVNNFVFLLDRLRFVATIIITCSFLGMIGVISSNVDYNYSMSYGNFTVIGVAIIEYFFLKEKQIIDGILLFIGLAELTIAGSRATFLVIISVFILYYALNFKIESAFQLLGIVFGLLLLIIFIVYFNSILSLISTTLSNFGITSRSIFLLTNGEFFSIASRSSIHKLCIQIIGEHPVLGIGAEGLQGLGYDNLTPHNTYLELLLYYGLLCGGMSILLLCSIWTHGLLYKKGSELQVMIIIWFSLYVSRSFTGTGILSNINFWILLALCIRSVQMHLSSGMEKGNRK